MLWDIFCRVIDNFGDIGICWRLSADLASRGHRVRLWVDDPAPLAWMAPGALEGQHPGVTVTRWSDPFIADELPDISAADVWIEGFGCELPHPFVAHFAGRQRRDGGPTPVWINLEYLSAETYVERSHGLPSPVMSGPATGWTKHFFYPGFTDKTGGLLREPGLSEAIKKWDYRAKGEWLASKGVPWSGERLISLFCYEPPLLQSLLSQLQASTTPTLLLVTAGRAAAQVKTFTPSNAAARATAREKLTIDFLPPLPQPEYDRLLWSCDVNFVRGEDSVIRALWAGKPFVWNIYPQEDGAHRSKLDAFMDTLQMPSAVRLLHTVWNGLPAEGPSPVDTFEPLEEASDWQVSVLGARRRLEILDDLTSRLIRFVQKKR